MNEAQKYWLLMLAFHHVADGKDLTYRIANENLWWLAARRRLERYWPVWRSSVERLSTRTMWPL